MQGHYGTKFLNLWRIGKTDASGEDIGVTNAMALWGEKLGGFAAHPEALREVLASLPAHPPTLSEFCELLRVAARRESQPLAIEHVQTDEERLAAAEAAHAASHALDRDSSYDFLGWARKPASQSALDLLRDGARTDNRLTDILHQHVASGVISADGKLLKIWQHGEWRAMEQRQDSHGGHY
jgi:hypothetical protein